MPRLLADYHHADLFEAHQLMFGDRLSYEVWAPYGMEWYDRWYWSFEREWHADAVARQYLVGIWRGLEPDANGEVRMPDHKHPGRELRGVSLDAALSRGWDLVLSSVPANAPGFQKLAGEVGAHWGVHIGNQWGDEAWERRPEFAVVTTTSPIPGGIPHVVVHQEFSLDHFRYEPPVGFGPVRSFVNCFPESDEYRESFLPLAREHPEWGWEAYGALGTGVPDEFNQCGNIDGVDRIGALMRESGAIFHAKHWSDGFGHVVHNAFAVGRPVIGYERYYADKLAGPLWQEGVTSFDVERHGRAGVVAILERMRAEPEWHRGLCESAANRFREVVDFAADGEALRQLIDGL